MFEIRFWHWNLDAPDRFGKPLKIMGWEMGEQQEQQILLCQTDSGALVAGRSGSGTSSKWCCEFVPSLLPSISSCIIQRMFFVSQKGHKPFTPASPGRARCGIGYWHYWPKQVQCVEKQEKLLNIGTRVALFPERTFLAPLYVALFLDVSA